jgi:hypothetical protein
MSFESKFTIAISPAMRAHIERLARMRGTSLADAIRYLILQDMERKAAQKDKKS